MAMELKDVLKIFHLASEQMEEDLKEQKKFSDLTSKQLECLEMIWKMKNPSVTELAEALKITKPSVSAMIDKLSQKEYVRKVKSDADRRSAHVHLTRKGLSAGQLHEDIHIHLARKMMKNLNIDEKNKLVMLLTKATSGIR